MFAVAYLLTVVTAPVVYHSSLCLYDLSGQSVERILLTFTSLILGTTDVPL